MSWGKINCEKVQEEYLIAFNDSKNSKAKKRYSSKLSEFSGFAKHINYWV